MRTIVGVAVTLLWATQLPSAEALDLWKLAGNQTATHRFSTLFTAHDVKNHLAKEDGLGKAIDWCKRTAVTKVYIETFRDGYQAERAALQHAKERFLAAGFDVSGCVTTTQGGEEIHPLEHHCLLHRSSDAGAAASNL